jgi:hypothetical protein
MTASGYTTDTVAERRAQTAPPARELAGLIRRMAVTLTSGTLWRAVGHLLLDRSQETKDAEVFGSLGFYSRPAAGANAEVIVVHPGGSANAVIVATRDEALRKLIDGQLGPDGAAMCNRATIILCKSDGTVEIRALGGSAAALATKADIDALKTWALTHTHVVAGVTAGAAAVTSAGPLPTPPSASGTSVLKGQ